MIRSMAFWSDWSWKVRVVALALVASFLALVLYQREPRYEGVSLSEWLRISIDVNSAGDSTRDSKSASEALNAMAPEALLVLEADI